MISNVKICQRVFLQGNIPSFPNRVRLVGGHFGQNGQKVYDNYKSNIFGAKQWVNMQGQGNILGRTDPPSRGNLHFVNLKWTNFKFMLM